MGFFDWIPTVPEVITSGMCLIGGHDYQAGYCQLCGKKKP